MSVVVDIATNLAAAGIGAGVAHATRRVRDYRRRRALDQNISEFFGQRDGKFLIVHSAIFDMPEQAYNYPATDTKSARALARLFEDANLREGLDFTIIPDRAIRDDKQLASSNVIVICGPARNSCFQRLVSPGVAMRYEMTAAIADGDRSVNVLTDKRRNTRMFSSRELVEQVEEGSENFDYGLIVSLPNFKDFDRRVVLLAGIHGTGTVGAAQFVADPDNLKLLNGRRSGGVVAEVVRVNYGHDIETPTKIELA